VSVFSRERATDDECEAGQANSYTGQLRTALRSGKIVVE
jgi:hypothetical protein